MNLDLQQRLARARQSLEGLSVGDAFGERFFTSPHMVERLIESRALASGPWQYTDDTVMALSVVDVLADCGEIDRDRLADFFAARYRGSPHANCSTAWSAAPWLPDSPLDK